MVAPTFLQGRDSLEDDVHTGRPQTIRTECKIQEVATLGRANRSQSVDDIAATVGVSHGTCYKILSDDLNMSRVTQHSVPRILSQDQRDDRMTICGDLISSADDDPTFLNQIITGDETWCFLYDPQLKRQSATWKTPLSPRQKKPRQDRSKGKVMLELFFDSNGIFHMEFIPEGATVNKTRYKEILGRLRDSICREIAKLQQHLALLKEQYVKLQTHCNELERKYALAAAAAGDINENSFVAKLLKTVAELFDQELYSDMKVKLNGQLIPAHRFVLAARSERWGVPSLADVDSLDWSDLVPEVGAAMLKWVYTDQVDFSRGDTFTLDLMRTANTYKLEDLVAKCEKALMASVNVRNCVRYYTTADEIGAETLKQHCSGLISAHWTILSELIPEKFLDHTDKLTKWEALSQQINALRNPAIQIHQVHEESIKSVQSLNIVPEGALFHKN
ncbi:hypothetical protein ANN_07078 [Periplaneta americana]|uniref:BTB domain-containing protein n=1 Tax=Periplaneta americana TaxID=6978 RepID=A0ABQ8THQ3_PERAM|nr:hypothetical protein ANN_07078 [Periplaneta americana]